VTYPRSANKAHNPPVAGGCHAPFHYLSRPWACRHCAQSPRLYLDYYALARTWL